MGVVFIAADFEKPLLTTDVGLISEYLDKGNFVVENTDEAITEKLMEIINNESGQSLKRRGIQHSQHIKESCDWNLIYKGIVEDVYFKNRID